MHRFPTRCETRMMDEENLISDAIRAISAQRQVRRRRVSRPVGRWEKKGDRSPGQHRARLTHGLDQRREKDEFRGRGRRDSSPWQPAAIETPVYLIDETLIEENMRVARYVKDRTGCKVLHALKSVCLLRHFSDDEQVPGRNMRKRPQ